MEQLLEKIEAYRQEIEQFEIRDARQLEEFRIKFLGTKGITKSLFGEMKNVPADQKKEFGQVLNDFKQFAESRFESAKEVAGNGKAVTEKSLDLSLPGDPVEIGARHPITLVRNRIINIFQRLGFFRGRWSRNRRRLAQFHRAQPARKPPCTRYAGYVLHSSESRLAVAYAYQ